MNKDKIKELEISQIDINKLKEDFLELEKESSKLNKIIFDKLEEIKKENN